MEGASTTRRVAKDMLRRKLKPKNKGQQMILNNYNTIQYIIDHQADDFNISRILEIHRSITNKTLDDPADEGRIRTDDNVMVVNAITGEIAHTPPPFSQIELLLKEVCAFANRDVEEPFVHPIIKAIIIHFLLSFIHPFVDGNGRTARSLFYWYLLKKGYWLTEYLSISRIIYKNKSSYEKAFLYVEHDEYDLSYFNHYNLKTMRAAYDDLKAYLQRKIKEQEGEYTFAPHYNINERQSRLIWIMNERPQTLLTVNEVTLRFGITPKTARADLKRLVELGLLTPLPINLRTTGYKRAELYDERLKELLRF
jgi:Fic family protein